MQLTELWRDGVTFWMSDNQPNLAPRARIEACLGQMCVRIEEIDRTALDSLHTVDDLFALIYNCNSEWLQSVAALAAWLNPESEQGNRAIRSAVSLVIPSMWQSGWVWMYEHRRQSCPPRSNAPGAHRRDFVRAFCDRNFACLLEIVAWKVSFSFRGMKVAQMLGDLQAKLQHASLQRAQGRKDFDVWMSWVFDMVARDFCTDADNRGMAFSLLLDEVIYALIPIILQVHGHMIDTNTFFVKR